MYPSIIIAEFKGDEVSSDREQLLLFFSAFSRLFQVMESYNLSYGIL